MDVGQIELKLSRRPHSPLFARLAGEYCKTGKLTEAKELCLSGLQKYPSYTTAYVVLAKCYVAEKQYEEAIEVAEKALSIYPDSGVLFELIRQCRELYEPDIVPAEPGAVVETPEIPSILAPVEIHEENVAAIEQRVQEPVADAEEPVEILEAGEEVKDEPSPVPIEEEVGEIVHENIPVDIKEAVEPSLQDYSDLSHLAVEKPVPVIEEIPDVIVEVKPDEEPAPPTVVEPPVEQWTDIPVPAVSDSVPGEDVREATPQLDVPQPDVTDVESSVTEPETGSVLREANDFGEVVDEESYPHAVESITPIERGWPEQFRAEENPSQVDQVVVTPDLEHVALSPVEHSTDTATTDAIPPNIEAEVYPNIVESIHPSERSWPEQFRDENIHPSGDQIVTPQVVEPVVSSPDGKISDVSPIEANPPIAGEGSLPTAVETVDLPESGWPEQIQEVQDQKDESPQSADPAQNQIGESFPAMPIENTSDIVTVNPPIEESQIPSEPEADVLARFMESLPPAVEDETAEPFDYFGPHPVTPIPDPEIVPEITAQNLQNPTPSISLPPTVPPKEESITDILDRMLAEDDDMKWETEETQEVEEAVQPDSFEVIPTPAEDFQPSIEVAPVENEALVEPVQQATQEVVPPVIITTEPDVVQLSVDVPVPEAIQPAASMITSPAVEESIPPAANPDDEVPDDPGDGRIVSQTLAEIYAKQGAYEEAILTYRLLKKRRPAQATEFDVRIKELRGKVSVKREEEK